MELVNKILAIPGDFKVRIGMMNPQWALKQLNELLEIYKHPKILKFLHIPVQSGSDKILKRMNRPYSIAEFKQVSNEFRREIPNISISTDIIVGFPEETEKDFQDTVKLLQWLKPEVLNLTKFWSRPGIKAAEMKQVPGAEIKRRSLEITKKFNKLKVK